MTHVKIDKAEKLKTPYAGLRRTVESTIKAVSMSDRMVEGFYSTFYLLDSDTDMLVSGCAADSIAASKTAMGNKIKNLYNHNWSRVTAVIRELEEAKEVVNGVELEGIRYRAEYAPSETALLEKIEMGAYDSHSIGFNYLEVELADKMGDIEERMAYEEYAPQILNPQMDKGYFWVVKKIKLNEGSVVSRAANPYTPFLNKSGEVDKPEILKTIKSLSGFRKYIQSGRHGTDEDFIKAEMEYSMMIQQLKYSLEGLGDKNPKQVKQKAKEESQIISAEDNLYFEQLKALL